MRYSIFFSIAVVLALLTVFGCQEEELTTYSGDYFVQFENDLSDSTSISFMFYPGKTYMDYAIPLELVGIASDKNLTYSVVADPEFTTATAKHYSLPEEQIFHAGRYVDTLYVRLNNTEDLSETSVRILLRIESTSDLLVGKIEQSVAIIWVTNTLAKPSWWDSDIDSYYLGTYSNKKYELFIEVTGIHDMSDLDDSEKRSYALQLKQYLEEHPTLDENNQYIEVPVL